MNSNDSQQEKFATRIFLPRHYPLQQPRIQPSAARMSGSLPICTSKGLDKYNFKLYALCIMSNHVHYPIEPATPEDLPTRLHPCGV
ncbi:MAG: transposase [Iphinoe sp. HA4291-MV1]|nr:transposase [Iphinoe sp. HA4291-MV1]